VTWTGGCQCGAVRFRIDGELGKPSICHCRMCQKATGGFFGPYVPAQIADVTWTRGARKRFQSSNKVWRGFCGDCGTPLTFESQPGVIDLAIGVFDDPAPLKPDVQLGSPDRLPWVDELPALPSREQDEPRTAAYLSDLVSYQHPDHETEAWTPRISST
jgi:hypothetical protein